MVIWERQSQGMGRATPTPLLGVGIRERENLEILLLEQVEDISPDTLILAEEFSDREATGTLEVLS